jgi:chromosomal replication initiator protein
VEQSIDVLGEVWQRALNEMQSKVSRAAFEGWLKHIKPVSLVDDVLTVAVPSEFARDWLEKRARRPLARALNQAAGRPLEIEFACTQMKLDLEGDNVGKPQPTRRTRSTGDDFGSTPLHPRYTFENFVVGKSNQFAHAAALAVANSPGRSYNPLFLYGGVGLGKTHLMQAIGHHVAEHSPGQRIAYVSGDTFTYHVVTSIREDRFSAFRRRYHSIDLWLVDDIQFIASRERTESEFFQAFNALYETGRQIVITSDRPPKELQVMDPRLCSRFEWGLIADIRPPDIETRIAILERKARHENTTVPQDVIHYIATIAPSNIRVLEGALIKVIAAASLLGREISLALATEHLKDHAVDPGIRPLSIATVKQVVANHYHLELDQLAAPTRAQSIVLPRQLAMYIARELLAMSYPEIARHFGGKDHTTVIHACSKIKQKIEVDPHLQAVVNELTANLRAR